MYDHPIKIQFHIYSITEIIFNETRYQGNYQQEKPDISKRNLNWVIFRNKNYKA